MEARFIPLSCREEKCWCGGQAEHKVEEVIFDDDPTGWIEVPRVGRFLARHPLTRYLCHEHFRQIMGPVSESQAKALPDVMHVATQQTVGHRGKAIYIGQIVETGEWVAHRDQEPLFCLTGHSAVDVENRARSTIDSWLDTGGL